MQNQIPNIDLVSLIEQKTGIRLARKASTDSGEYWGTCPFCGKGDNRFHVWPNSGRPHYWCRVCHASGDAVQFLRDYPTYSMGMSFVEACEELGLDPDAERENYAAMAEARTTIEENPPSKQWQETGMLFVERAERYLWHPNSPEGRHALAYLHARGFTDETIKKARLGYVPLNKEGRWWGSKPGEGEFERWGIDPVSIRDDKKRERGYLLIPDGILIPWFEGDTLWKIAFKRPFRRPDDEMDYGQVLGSGEGLYNVDSVQFEQPAMMVEGEFDCLSVMQEAGDVIACVATGSDRRGRIGRWVGELTLASFVLQSFDRDMPNRETGERSGDLGAEYWLEVLPNSMRWQPWADEWSDQLRFKDPNEMLQHADAFKEFTGYTLRGWVEAGIETAQLPAPKLPSPEPPDGPKKSEHLTILPTDNTTSEQPEKAEIDEIDRLEQFADIVSQLARKFGDAIITKATGQTIEERARELRTSYQPVTLPALPRKECPHVHNHTPCKGKALAHGWCEKHARSHNFLCLMAQLGFPEVDLPFQAGYQEGKPIMASRIIGAGVANAEEYAEIAPERWLIRDMARIRERYGLLRMIS